VASRVGIVATSSQLVGDQDHGLALALERAKDPEQALGLLRRQDRRRFVEDQDLGAAMQRLQDLDALLKSDGQVADHGVGIDLKAIILRQTLQRRPGRGQRRRQAPASLDAKHEILGNRHVLDQHEVLVDHADSRRDRVLRRGDVDRPAADADLARIGPVVAVEDAHQGRLAGAVLADDPVDRALGHGQADRLVGVNGAEALVDPDEFDRGRGRQRAHCTGQEFA
jgi:hypothetical protein